MQTLRIILLCAGLFGLDVAAAAQFTTVTGTVTDPNGLPYAGGTISASLVSSATPVFTATGFGYTPPSSPAGLNPSGAFTIRLADNTQLTPGGSTWTFQVCSSGATVQPAVGKGSVCFTVSGVTISGISQSISATLNAVALALTVPFGTSSFINPMTTQGDLIVGGAAGAPLRLPVNPGTVPQTVVSVGGATSLAFGGVPVDATNPVTLLTTDRANYVNWTAGTALALPAISGNFASNFPFVIKNSTTATLVITPNAAAGDLIDGALTSRIPPGGVAFVYQDSTSAPGHWFTIQFNNITAWWSQAATQNNAMGATTQNTTRIWALYLNTAFTSSTGICYQIQTADNSANVYDIGLYNSAGTLVVHVGATAGTTLFAATGQKCVNWTAATALPADNYALALTSSAAAPTAQFGGAVATSLANLWAAVAATGGGTAGGALNASITFPATSWAGNTMVNFSLH